MKFSGLFRTRALALITFSQLAWPNLAHSQKEAPNNSPKTLLKSEKEVAGKKPTAAKPITQETAVKQALPNNSVPTEKKATVNPIPQGNVVKQSSPIKTEVTEKKAVANPNTKDTVVKQPTQSKSVAPDKKAVAEPVATKNNAGKEEDDKKDISSEAKKKQVHSAKTSQKESTGLIPPPPAYQPSYLIGPGNSAGGFQPEFMTKEMAQQRLKDLEKQVFDAKNELNDKTAKVQEMKERSERFASLYSEGVVSRHEFEAAGKEAEEVQKQLEQYKANLAELEAEKKALNEKVKPAEKKNLQASKSSNNHKRRANGSRS